jgi:chorismate dehydratase
MSLIRISAVSYLNSKPFIYGLQQSDIIKDIQLSLDTPAACAEKLLNNKVDIGLVPVAILPRLSNYHILSNYCIGAVGPVSSVKLYSRVPLKNIESIWLDHQSRTSVALTRVLAKEHWHIDPKWLKGEEGYEKKITGNTAGVVIGDRTFELNDKFEYQYDLSEQWYQFTKLPFVFACWVTTKELSPAFHVAFNAALEKGVDATGLLSKEINKTGKYKTDVYEYLHKYLSYKFDDEKRKGLKLFLEYLKQQ